MVYDERYIFTKYTIHKSGWVGSQWRLSQVNTCICTVRYLGDERSHIDCSTNYVLIWWICSQILKTFIWQFCEKM